MLCWLEHRLTYFPTRKFVAQPDVLGVPFQDVTFTAADGVRLHGWLFWAATNSARRDFVVLVCHGNGGNISHRLELYDALLEQGVAVFAFDYRGYGRSQGNPTEHGTYLDAIAAHRRLCEVGFDPWRIIAFGESLGGAVATELALRETVGGVVLQGSFTSLADIRSELLPWLPARWFVGAKYDVRSKLPRLRCPVLLMHSRADTLIRFHHAEANFAAANEPKLLRELEGGHNDALSNRELFVEGIRKFFDMVEQHLQKARPDNSSGPRRHG